MYLGHIYALKVTCCFIGYSDLTECSVLYLATLPGMMKALLVENDYIKRTLISLRPSVFTDHWSPESSPFYQLKLLWSTPIQNIKSQVLFSDYHLLCFKFSDFLKSINPVLRLFCDFQYFKFFVYQPIRSYSQLLQLAPSKRERHIYLL